MFKSTMVCCVLGVAVVLIGVLSLTGASSSERYIGNAVNKDYPGMCFYNETQTPIALNTVYRPTDECVEIFCREDYVLRLLYCSRYMVGDGCVVNHHPGLEFPDCCPTVDCPHH